MTAIRSETADGVATLTLADVDNRNALGGAVVGGLIDGLARANADPEVRVVVITNDGPIFCAGANIKEQSSANEAGGDDAADERPTGGLEVLLQQLQQSPTPVVGKINGHVVGGGMGLAAALDISVAADDAKFGFTEVRIGVIPAIISVVCLAKMRRGDAMETFLRGQRFPAGHAADLGLINRAVPADQLDEEVASVVSDLLRGGPQALGQAKRLVNEVPAMAQDDAFAWTSQLSASLFAGEEAREGMRAFIEKRPARWVPDQT
ncbi:MAG: enoyl-CoA hydratase-related protein [Acidimicrobiia bacterium]|nr:enoyl-CoA hydratase-related protein [Acidimicrobiia bacterium]